jgi:protein-L-isoaspartate(D-aspartate) O-methyltransferase
MTANVQETTTSAWLEQHRSLIDRLLDDKLIRTQAVADAFWAVPRHLFLPDVPWEQVYSDEAIATKTEAGRAISSSSQPAMMAIMLEQLELKPGHRVLEIGAGTGYNAALMAHLVGDHGHVVTMDIDEDIVTAARHHLLAAGFGRVELICADGGLGHAPGAPYDRIILTAGGFDIAPAWQEQLAEDGRLVMPLSLNGPQQSVAFTRSGKHLRSVSLHGCGFMPLRGAFAGPEESVSLAPEPGLEIVHSGRWPVDTAAVYRWLAGPFQEVATSIEVTGAELWFSLNLWLAVHEPDMCSLNAAGAWAERHIVPYLFGCDRQQHTIFATALLDENGLAVLSRPPGQPLPWHKPPENKAFELYLCVYGAGETAAHRLLQQLHAWDQAGRPSGQNISIRVQSLGESYVPQANEVVLKKRWTQMVINWT